MELAQGVVDPLIPLAQQEGALPLEQIFARRAPLEVEVGTGKGHTLVMLAQRDADTDFLGIEVGSRWARLTRVHLIRAVVPNARLVHAEAEWVLKRYLPRGSVRRFHVYFPDPWPKNRHANRRLFRPAFVAQMARCLEPQGQVCIATDHPTYFRQILEVMGAAGFRPHPDTAWPQDPVSSFEAKYRDQGRAIHRAVWYSSGL